MYAPLDVWNVGEVPTAAHLNQAVDALNKLSVLFAAEGLETFQTPGGLTVTPGEQQPRTAIVRMQVTTPNAGPGVVLAKLYDGTSATGEEIPVAVYFQREEDTEIFAFVPAGGTAAVYDDEPVTWQEVFSLGAPQYVGMTVSATAVGVYGWAFQEAVVLPEGI